MSQGKTRRSDRITLELPIQVSGTDGMAKAFVENARTLVVSRHGAKILLNRRLVPEQELTMRCITTEKEADVRIVGQLGKSSEGYYYGIEILDPELDVWGIDFPALAESEKAVARVLLECAGCHSRELTYLDELEAEVFDVNKCISRPCKRCSNVTLWKESRAATEQLPLAVVPNPPLRDGGALLGTNQERAC
jgi:hypothetical protein